MAVVPIKLTVPVKAATLLSVKVAVVRVEASIASEKAAEIEVLIATPVATAAGFVELTMGAVISDGPGEGRDLLL
jgi:hypothetical protein